MEGIKKLLSAQTAGLPNWAWLLIIAGGVTAAIVVPKLFGGKGSTSSTDTGTSTDTSGAIPTAPPSPDTSGYNPFQGGYGGGGGTTDTGTGTPATITDTATGTPPPPTTVFPPVQPSAPAPPPSATTTVDQCKQRQGCIDYHIAHDCSHLKDKKEKAECEQHWTIKCANDHPCGHSLVPSVHATTDLWPYTRQQRRDTNVMDTSIQKGMIDGNIQ